MSHPFVEALRPQKRNVSWTDWLRTQLSRLGIGGSTTPPLLHLFDYLPKQKHILITGLDAAGKSTLLRKYLSPNGDEGVVTHRPALGCLVEETCHGNVYFYTLDLGGGRPRAVMNMEREIIADMDAVVWVLDSTDRDRLVEAKEEMARMICGAAGLGRDKPVLLLANKQQVFTEKGDCVPAIEYSEAGNLFVHVLGDRRWYVEDTDLICGLGVWPAFVWLGDDVGNFGEERQPVEDWAKAVRTALHGAQKTGLVRC